MFLSGPSRDVENHSSGFQKAKPHRTNKLLVSRFDICKSAADAAATTLGSPHQPQWEGPRPGKDLPALGERASIEALQKKLLVDSLLLLQTPILRFTSSGSAGTEDFLLESPFCFLGSQGQSAGGWHVRRTTHKELRGL